MRQEEEFAKDTICEWLNCNQDSLPKKITPEPFGKDTAPDYMFEFDEKKIYVEVTRSGMGFLLNPQDIKFDNPNPVKNGLDRIKYEVSAGDFLEKQYELDIKNGNAWIGQGESLVVIILSPIPLEQRGKIGKKLLKVLKKLYEQNEILHLENRIGINNGEFTLLTGNTDCPGLTLQVLKTNFYQNPYTYTPIVVNFFVVQSSNNKPYDCSLDNQSLYILESVVRKKEEKCKHLQAGVWLVILNEHPILEIKDYTRVMPYINEMLKSSIFSKIFIVDVKKAYEFYQVPIQEFI